MGAQVSAGGLTKDSYQGFPKVYAEQNVVKTSPFSEPSDIWVAIRMEDGRDSINEVY